MIRIIRWLLLLAVAGLGVCSVVYHDRTAIERTLADPRTDPQFSDIVSNPLQVFQAEMNPTTIHEGDYSIALRNFQKEQTVIDNQIYDAGRTFDTVVTLLLIAIVSLLIALLPWPRWTRRAQKSSSALAQQAVVLASNGGDVWKAKTAASPVVGRHGLKSYSVADELLKWNELRSEGVVSNAEFEEARKNLLSR